MKTKLLKLTRFTHDRDGQQYIAKSGPNKGNPYVKLSIQIDHPDYENMYLGGFENFTSKNWEVGQEIDIEVTKREYNGKEFFDFKPNRPLDASLEERLQKIEADITNLKLSCTKQQPSSQDSSSQQLPPQ
jgi:hypothetical protein